MPLAPDSNEHLAELCQEFQFQGYISQTEHRAISLKQLKRVIAYATCSCGKWIDTTPKQYSKTSGQKLSMQFLNLYHLNSWVIMPATKEKDCAFVEMLTSDAQQPSWFVSHWWGEKHEDFVACVAKHVEIRGTTEDSPYWTCAYANRQHSLAGDVSPNPRESSFYKAIQLSKGVLLILDGTTKHTGPATPFTRIWCAFEESISFEDNENDGRDGPMLLDIASYGKGQAELITDGLTDDEQRLEEESHKGAGTQKKVQREMSFPLTVVEQGLTLELQHAKASVEEDRKSILNCLAGMPLDSEPHVEHIRYQEVNCRLRARFAIAAWPKAVESGVVANLNIPAILAADAWREHLDLDLSQGRNLSNAGMASIGIGLPAKLRTLKLSFDDCDGIGDTGLAALVTGFPPSLEVLDLSLSMCENITDAGIAALGKGIPKALQVLTLELNKCGFGDPGLASIAAGLPETLQQLCLRMTSVTLLTNAGAAALGQSLSSKTCLWKISIMLHGQKDLTDVGIVAIARGYPPSLTDMTRNFCSPGSTGCSMKMNIAFGSQLGMDAFIEELKDQIPSPAMPAEPALPAEPERPQPVVKAKEGKSSICALL